LPSHDETIESQDLGFEGQQLSAKSGNAGPADLGEPSVTAIGDNVCIDAMNLKD